MAVMHVLLIPEDDEGCGYYRMRLPATCATGVHTWVIPRRYGTTIERLGISVGSGTDGRPTATKVDKPDAHVIVLQRPMRKVVVDAIPLLQAHGARVVVELDDDFESLPVDHSLFYVLQPSVTPDWNVFWLRRACEQADWVTVSTPALRRYASHGRVSVIRNTVPAANLDVGGLPSGPLTLGWYGNVDTHPGDPDVAAQGIRAVLDDHAARFLGIGDDRITTAFGVIGQTRPWVEPADLPFALSALNVGVVPLRRHPFNDAKSWIKGLELSSVGVPFVASPTPEYEYLASLGAGDLASHPTLWARRLRRLLGDSTYRAERAETGREVAAGWTIEGHAHEWVEAWERAADRSEAA